jgi:ABC-type lipoprotein export system ATPase subunit
VSIIGGRGTGKSQLINYIASSFNRNNNPGKYNLETDITIGRKASLTEEAKVFKVSDEPNAPFMYIAQSQIKELVEKKEKLSDNILETIGVADKYGQSSDYSKGIVESINEYDRITKVLNADGKTLEERKGEIQGQIKRYNEFIQNITSEQNKKKLEDYKSKVERLHLIENWQTKIKDQYEKNESFVKELNESIKLWNEKLEVSVPLADIQATQKYIIEVLLPKLDTIHIEIEKAIENTKNEFKEYKGDLTTLLSNVSSYQTKVSELTKEKEEVEQEEIKYNTISTETFKRHGETIKKSIENYTKIIADKWQAFKGDTESTELYKKELLDVILKEGMGVEATISFDKDNMYNLLLRGLDGRSYNIEKLQSLLAIDTIDDFYSFICQTGTINAFSNTIRDDLRRRVLTVFYKEYTDFISIGVKVTLNGKPITKLSYGQQGTIYLRLQLAANLFSETIIYDQPEDDLDNEFISDELISIFKTLKKYRQIIIVSHNANLVVNSDSEQVIVAKNTDGILSYNSGSLEDPFINSEVCRVLEGGQKAFEDRERKYRLLW